MKPTVKTLFFIVFYLTMSNLQAKDLMIKNGGKNSFSYFPHKGAFLLGAEFLAGDKIDHGFKKTIDAENNYLTSLGLTWNTLDESGKILSSEDINKYYYSGDGVTVGLRLLYFTTDAFAIGGRFGNYAYTQTLTVDKKDETGTLMEFNFIGPSLNWYVYKKKRIGLLLKSDISLVIGKKESLPALNLLLSDTYFSDKLPVGLESIVKNDHLTSKFYGFQFNAGVSANYFVSNWFNIDAGVQLNSFSGSFKGVLWAGTENTIKSISPVFNLSVNFLFKNKHVD